MKCILIILCIWMLLGAISFFWGIYKAPTMEEHEDYYIHDEDWLLKNEPNYLGQGRWIE